MGGYGMAAKMRELTEQNMQEFVKEVEKRKIPLHSVLIAQHGNLLFEKYYAPYCRNKLQRMFSVTKSLLHWQSDCWSRKGKFPCRILSVIISRNICPGECILGWQR